MRTEIKYLEIADKIKKKIYTNIYKKDTLLPSEKDLCAEYEVSRETVKKAIRQLVEEGYLYTVAGKGTFVFDRVQDEYFTEMTSTSFFKNGYTQADLVFAKIIKPDIYDVYNMNVSPDENIISIQWLLKNNGVPIAYDIKNLLYTTGIPLDESKLQYSSLPAMLPAESTARGAAQKSSISSASPPMEVMKHLKINPGKCKELIKIQISLRDRDEEVLGWNIIYIVPEEFKLTGESV